MAITGKTTFFSQILRAKMRAGSRRRISKTDNSSATNDGNFFSLFTNKRIFNTLSDVTAIMLCCVYFYS